MKTTRTPRAIRRVSATSLLVASLTFSLAACGGEDDPAQPQQSATATRDADEKPADDGKTYPNTSQTIARLKGEGGIEMIVYEAKRDNGGFLTVSGEFKNTSGKRYTTPVQWSGEEREVVNQGRSVAGMTLVDSVGKKRYYVLRDTDNRPLTTTSFKPSIQAGESLPFFAQFPAPPEGTASVDLQFPGFPNAPIELS
ncbi:hypothetical protein [Streptomyces sp. NPDC060194]|uniref:hypothetical protein n=1 Tax=Streptomyces sp. NPDC060194 TaxID=3347069 RepID=UPI003664B1E5